MAAQHLLVMHALGPAGAVALGSQELLFLQVAIGHLVAARTTEGAVGPRLALTDGLVTSTSAAGPVTLAPSASDAASNHPCEQVHIDEGASDSESLHSELDLMQSAGPVHMELDSDDF